MFGKAGARRAAVHASSVVIAAVVVSVLCAAPASAGEWMQVICQNPHPGQFNGGSPAPVQGFVASSASLGTAVGPYETCSSGAGGELVAALDFDPGAAPADGATAAWTYTAPPGSVIAGGELDSAVNSSPANGGFSWISTPDDSPVGAVDECGYGPSFGCNT